MRTLRQRLESGPSGTHRHARDAVEPVRPVDERSDAELVSRARAGDDLSLAELLTRYRSLARSKARSYFLAGGEQEDLVQEAMIGLYKAVRDFDETREASFHGFADMCVTRQVISAIKAANRHKHGPLNSSVSLDRPVGDDEGGTRTLADTLRLPAAQDTADLVISAERIRDLRQHLGDVLSDLEVEVLRLHVEGRPYTEIADVLHRHVKSIDNALQRIKRKLDQHLRERALADVG